jgi:hypothetical protein
MQMTPEQKAAEIVRLKAEYEFLTLISCNGRYGGNIFIKQAAIAATLRELESAAS